MEGIIKKAGKGIVTLGTLIALNLFPIKAIAGPAYDKLLKDTGCYTILNLQKKDYIDEKKYPQITPDEKNLLVIGYASPCYDKSWVKKSAENFILKELGLKPSAELKSIRSEPYILQKKGESQMMFGGVEEYSIPLASFDKKTQEEYITKYGSKQNLESKAQVNLNTPVARPVKRIVILSTKETSETNNASGISGAQAQVFTPVAKTVEKQEKKKEQVSASQLTEEQKLYGFYAPDCTHH